MANILPKSLFDSRKKVKMSEILGYFDNFHIGCVQACSFWLLKEGRGCFLLDVTVALKYNSFSFS